MKPLKIYQNKLIGYVYFYTDYNNMRNKDKLLSELAESVITSSNLYKSKNKKGIVRHLGFGMFDDKIHIPHKINNKKVFYIVEKAIKKCHKITPAEPTRIFIFPSFSTFVKTKMSGVGGVSLWENTVFIFIIPTKGWETSLRNIVFHEFNHSATYKYHRWETLLDSIIFEGLAENFRKYAVGGKTAPWSKALTVRDAKNIFARLKPLLHSKDEKIYSSVFFDNDKYPLWAGYSIGYHLVKSFLNKNKRMKWQNIIKVDFNKIVKESGW